MKGVANPIFPTPDYSSSTGSDIPRYTNITFSDASTSWRVGTRRR